MHHHVTLVINAVSGSIQTASTSFESPFMTKTHTLQKMVKPLKDAEKTGRDAKIKAMSETGQPGADCQGGGGFSGYGFPCPEQIISKRTPFVY